MTLGHVVALDDAHDVQLVTRDRFAVVGAEASPHCASSSSTRSASSAPSRATARLISALARASRGPVLEPLLGQLVQTWKPGCP